MLINKSLELGRFSDNPVGFELWIERRAPISTDMGVGKREFTQNDFDKTDEGLVARLERFYPRSRFLIREVVSWLEDGQVSPDVCAQHLQVIEALD